MRLSLRFVLPLLIVLALVAYGVVPLVDALTLKWFTRDLESRSKLLASTMEVPLAELVATKAKAKIFTYFHKVIQDERLYALGFCDLQDRLLYQTLTFPDQLSCESLGHLSPGSSEVVKLPQGPLHVMSSTIQFSGRPTGRLMLVHDMSFVHQRSTDTKWYVFYLFTGLAALISLVTVLVAHISWRGWIAGVRALLDRGGLPALRRKIHSPELHPVAHDLNELVRELEADRRMRDESQITWSPASLKTILHEHLSGDEILIVSNREPYIHTKRGQKIDVQLPASGLISALEPVMRACSGVWIAHGSGSADREVVDSRDHVRVPPDHPSYDIRRIWITPDEEAGYYYGFANEGLWPLCHNAHVRPTFRTSDWEHYVTVNERFAQAVIEEAKTDDPVVLVQDYHLALLPKMVREKLPNATIITFWHIPWPNAESYGICPWRKEILEGMLGSSIVGFHTRVHCNHFIYCIDRTLEARIDRDASTVSYGGKLTAVKNYPISIEWPSRWLHNQRPVPDCRRHIRERHAMSADRLVGIGVDRLDYTKGIIERFLAVERLFELQPEWIGKFAFIQIAAPSRTIIDQYQHFHDQVYALAERINKRFGQEGYEPIILKIRHHEPPDVYEYYRAADVCVVTSLHDGMNLVAKEFIAARDDDQGVLILSEFTGAVQELSEALVVNPYDMDQCAAALHLALKMPAHEQRARMRSMRGLIQEFNVYRWAGRMLTDAARMRKRIWVLKQVGRSASLPR
jgi:trehalose 6-phosphate synthase